MSLLFFKSLEPSTNCFFPYNIWLTPIWRNDTFKKNVWFLVLLLTVQVRNLILPFCWLTNTNLFFGLCSGIFSWTIPGSPGWLGSKNSYPSSWLGRSENDSRSWMAEGLLQVNPDHIPIHWAGSAALPWRRPIFFYNEIPIPLALKLKPCFGMITLHWVKTEVPHTANMFIGIFTVADKWRVGQISIHSWFCWNFPGSWFLCQLFLLENGYIRIPVFPSEQNHILLAKAVRLVRCIITCKSVQWILKIVLFVFKIL